MNAAGAEACPPPGGFEIDPNFRRGAPITWGQCHSARPLGKLADRRWQATVVRSKINAEFSQTKAHCNLGIRYEAQRRTRKQRRKRGKPLPAGRPLISNPAVRPIVLGPSPSLDSERRLGVHSVLKAEALSKGAAVSIETGKIARESVAGPFRRLSNRLKRNRPAGPGWAGTQQRIAGQALPARGKNSRFRLCAREILDGRVADYAKGISFTLPTRQTTAGRNCGLARST